MDDGLETAQLNATLRLELIAAEREFLHAELREGHITDESRRRIERELDLEEATISNKGANELPL
jgi:CPA1 family monovalent cation:H+ antiporter